MISWQSYSPSEQRCRRLVRRIVHSFMTPEHAVVIDAVLRNTANRGLSTPQIVEIIKLCRRTTQLKLNDMFRAGFVFCESSKDASGKARVGANLQQFFVFDYRKFVTRLAYRNLMVHEKFEAEAQKAAPEEKYFCVNSDCADL
jgi:transcription initiation factor IIE alpha subunit